MKFIRYAIVRIEIEAVDVGTDPDGTEIDVRDDGHGYKAV